jgi:GNAT superfamily N-acetyltransferase
MADAIIDRLSPNDLDTITHLYNTVFRPERDRKWIERRMMGRHKPLVQVARIDRDAVGFYMGFELKPNTHFGWLLGVVPELRRGGIGSQLMHAAIDWARTEGYHFMRIEATNRARPILHFAISAGYEVVGVRWDADLMANLVIFEKNLHEVMDG